MMFKECFRFRLSGAAVTKSNHDSMNGSSVCAAGGGWIYHSQMSENTVIRKHLESRKAFVFLTCLEHAA